MTSMDEDIPKNEVTNFVAGIVAGSVIAGFFSPWDRALYISVRDRIPFFDKTCWRNPYQGFLNGMLQRTLSSGLYFPLYDFYLRPVSKFLPLSDNLVPIVSGNFAGITSGILLNSLCVIKYGNWGSEISTGETAKMLIRKNGLKTFLNGTGTTMCRDAVFGSLFAGIRYNMTNENSTRIERMYASVIAGGAGTIFSSPFNYARNMKYAAGASGLPSPSILKIFSDLKTDVMNESRPLSSLQGRLRVGWGTTRVAIGMAVGFELYEKLKYYLRDIY